jgi:hypothetical protein
MREIAEPTLAPSQEPGVRGVTAATSALSLHTQQPRHIAHHASLANMRHVLRVKMGEKGELTARCKNPVYSQDAVAPMSYLLPLKRNGPRRACLPLPSRSCFCFFGSQRKPHASRFVLLRENIPTLCILQRCDSPVPSKYVYPAAWPLGRCSNPGGQGISTGDARPVPHTKSYNLVRKDLLPKVQITFRN